MVASGATRKPPSWDFYPLPDGVTREVERPDPMWLRCLGVAGFPVRVWRLRRWLQRHQIDIAIGITSIPATKLLLATRGLGIPTVVSERNSPLETNRLGVETASPSGLSLGCAALGADPGCGRLAICSSGCP